MADVKILDKATTAQALDDDKFFINQNSALRQIPVSVIMEYLANSMRAASSISAGLMTATDKAKLDNGLGYDTNSTYIFNVGYDTVTQKNIKSSVHVASATAKNQISERVIYRERNTTDDSYTDYILYGTHNLFNATQSKAGLMSAADKKTLDIAGLTGEVKAYAGNTLPTGYLLCNGAAISRTTYAALYAAIGTTYGSGDGSTSFNLPNYTDKFLQGSATAGTVKAAGLPNISGQLDDVYGGTLLAAAGWGSFNKTTTNGVWQASLGNSTSRNATIVLDASASSSIYGASTTVQPPAVTVRYIIKY